MTALLLVASALILMVVFAFSRAWLDLYDAYGNNPSRKSHVIAWVCLTSFLGAVVTSVLSVVVYIWW